jgi:hypothetical protein
MKNDKSTNGFDVLEQALQMLAPWRATSGDGWVHFWRSQDKVLDSMQKFANGWFERRHVATTSALDAAQRTCQAKSPVEAMHELQVWSAGSMQRVVEDGFACQQHLVTLFELASPPVMQKAEPQAADPPSNEKTRTHATATAMAA